MPKDNNTVKSSDNTTNLNSVDPAIEGLTAQAMYNSNSFGRNTGNPRQEHVVSDIHWSSKSKNDIKTLEDLAKLTNTFSSEWKEKSHTISFSLNNLKEDSGDIDQVKFAKLISTLNSFSKTQQLRLDITDTDIFNPSKVKRLFSEIKNSSTTEILLNSATPDINYKIFKENLDGSIIDISSIIKNTPMSPEDIITLKTHLSKSYKINRSNITIMGIDNKQTYKDVLNIIYPDKNFTQA